MSRRLTLTDALAAHFRAHAGEWLDGMALARIAGQYAWRSRVSDLRKRGMVIENRQRHVRPVEGRRVTISEYRFVPASLLEVA